MPRRKRDKPGELEIALDLLAGNRRMFIRQFDGSQILADCCTCGFTIAALNCPIDAHRWKALCALQDSEDTA